MSFIDIVLGSLLVFGLIRGIRNGLFVELASLISFFIGIYFAVKFSHLAGSYLGDSKSAKILAFLIILVAVVVGIHLLAKVFSKVANFVFLGWLNRLGGAVFATLKSAILLGIILTLFQKINFYNYFLSKETQEKSIFYKPILKTSEVLLPVLKDWFTELKSKSETETETESEN
jgi:membrane protein required for colicin V production